jgi:D-alanyl-D-alanine carboxypeptidase/Putative peptidoglycan binding domain
MRLLKIGDANEDVTRWEFFLRGQNLFHEVVDGKFDINTHNATVRFQTMYRLQPDGIVGNKTVGQAMLLGFGVIIDPNTGITSENFPQKPAFSPLVSNADRERVFGRFAYRAQPLPGNPENIEITDNWERDNIITVQIPQLIRIKGNDRVAFHKLGANQLKKLWQDWEDADLIHNVLTWEGSYDHRFVRGSTTILSNHAFGSAFDINYSWNKLGVVPALVGQKGSVRELVKIANDNGFYWGGHFNNRKDGMHFEVAQIK